MIRPVAAESPWAPMLGLLPPELGHSLGPWLDQLASAVGPLRARARTGTGAPDGFDGLSLRGPYDRLVLSEWALADALPEEFVRRAAQGEHAFYQLARRDEAKAKTSIALFDPGPMQLGGPRLGQFAALLVLAGRARAAGANFGWSTLQRPPEQADASPGLQLGLDAAGVRRFLLGRTAFAPTAKDLDAWFELARKGDWEDVWIVGPPETIAPGRRLAGVKTPVGRIEVRDVFEAKVRALDLTVARGAHRKTLRVPLPPEDECRQLLRGGVNEPKPFTPVRLARTPGVARPVSAPILLAEGRKVAFVDAGDSVTVYTVPDAPSPKRARFHRYAIDKGHTVLGLGWVRRRLVLVSEAGGELHVRDVQGDLYPASSSRRPFTAPEVWEPSMRPRQLQSVEVLTHTPGEGQPPLAFLTAPSCLVGLRPNRALMLTTGYVTAAVTVLGALRVVTSGPSDLTAEGTTALPTRQLTFLDASAAVITSPPGMKLTIAWQDAAGLWNVPQAGGATRHDVPGSAWVLGLIVAPKSPVELAPLILDEDRRSVGWVGADATGVLFTLASRALHATATPRGDRVAFVLDDGSVEVWSLPAAECLLRVAAPV